MRHFFCARGLLLTEGMMSILLNYSGRVGFRTMLCMLSWGRSLSYIESNGAQQINVHRFFCPSVEFLDSVH